VYVCACVYLHHEQLDVAVAQTLAVLLQDRTLSVSSAGEGDDGFASRSTVTPALHLDAVLGDLRAKAALVIENRTFDMHQKAPKQQCG
jgi:hypothetical protein